MRILLFACLTLLLPLAATAQEGETDRGYIQGLLEDALSAPGRTVRMQGFAGALSRRATIDTVTVTDTKGVWFTASDLSLSWNRSAILRGRIEIDEITIAEIDLPRRPLPEQTTLPTPEAKGSFALPDLPVSVDIAKMQIAKATLGKGLFGEAATIGLTGSADLADGAGTVNITLKRQDQPGEFSLSGGFNNTTRRLAIDLSLTEPQGGIAATLLDLPGTPAVALTIAGDDPLGDFTATLDLATDGQDRLSGTLSTTTDDTGTARFAADLGGDIAPVLVPEFAEFLGDRIALTAEGQRDPDGTLSLDALDLTTAAMDLSGSAQISADGWPDRFTLTGAIIPPEGDTVTLPLPGPRTEVTSASFAASFDASAGEAWQIDGTLRGLTQPELALDRVQLSGTGTISQSTQSITGALDLTASGLAPADPALARAIGPALDGTLAFDWTQGAPLSLRNIALNGADYGLTGATTISGLIDDTALTIAPSLTLASQDLSRFALLTSTALSGAADLAISGRVEPLTGQLSLTFAGTTTDLATGIAQLDPLLAGPGTLSLQLTRDTQGVRAEPLRIATNAAQIEASANLRSDGSTLRATVDLTDIAPVLPDLRGPATLSLAADQTGEIWAITSDLSLPGQTRTGFIGTITGDGTARLVAQGELTAETAQLSGFSSLAGRSLAGAGNLTASGTVDLLASTFDVTASGTTRALDVSVPTIRPLLRGTTQLALAVRRDNAGTLTITDLSARNPALSADLSGRVADTVGALNYQLALTNLAQLVPELPGPARISGTASKFGSTWTIDASGTGPGGITLSTNGQALNNGTRLNGQVTGRVPLALANPQLDGQALSGMAALNLSVNGPPALGSVSGRITVDGARLADPSLALALNDIRGTLSLAAGRADLAFEGAVSTGGRVRLSGPITLSQPYDANLVAEFLSVTARDATLFETTFSGRSTVTGPLAGGARIGGMIDVDTAEIRIPNLGPLYSMLDGLRHINPAAPVQRTLRYAGLDEYAGQVAPSGPGYPIDLTIRAPNRIFVRGRGLDAELGGALRLTGSTSALVPTGRFDLIRGRLDLLTRRLTLTEGSVTLRGSFDPVIAFAADSQVEDTTISLRIDGLASAPDLRVISSPELPEEEALSLFLFGRDATRISPFQAVQLASAIATLSGRGGTGIAGRVRESLGVDDFDFATNEDGTTEASVGKYLSDDVYSDVTVKSDGTSRINLNLELNPSVTLRGHAGNDGNAGVGIFFERDY